MALRWMVFGAVLCALPHLSASDTKKTPPNIPLAQLLKGPERSDFRAEFAVMKPRLSYQQRWIVEMRAAINGGIAAGRNLHLWVKVAPKGGAWFDGQIYQSVQVGTELRQKNEVQLTSGFYAEPGEYDVGFVLYDAGAERFVVHHDSVKVERLKDDLRAENPGPLQVDFASDLSGNVPVFESLRDERPSAAIHWPLDEHAPSFPVANTAPVLVDVILNFSDRRPETTIPPSIFRRSPYRRRRGELPELEDTPEKVAPSLRTTVYTVAALGSALAQIKPAQGCVRVSAMHLDSSEVSLDRKKPQDVNWESLQVPAKLEEISVSALQKAKDEPAFLRDFLARLPSEPACAPQAARHVILFVSRSFSFPDGAHKASFTPEPPPQVDVFYLAVHPQFVNEFDDLPGFFKPAHPHNIDVYDPARFRQALREIIRSLGAK